MGVRLSILGEKRVAGISEEGAKMAINFQVTSVDKPLIAVSRLAAGHAVWFGSDGGTARDKANGKVTHLEKKSTVYVMRPGFPVVGGQQAVSHRVRPLEADEGDVEGDEGEQGEVGQEGREGQIVDAGGVRE